MPILKNTGSPTYNRCDISNPWTEPTESQGHPPDNIQYEADNDHIFISNLLAKITHELRTPMIGILGSVDLLEHSPLNQTQLASVDAIRNCGEQLLNTIDDMLQISKIEIGLQELNPSPTNLQEFLKDTAAVIESNLRKKGLLLELDIDRNLPRTAILDQIKLRQVIINLLQNAVKFTHRGGIRFTAHLESKGFASSWLLITIADTGIGIPPDELGSVFASLSQVASSTTREYGGNGLGLYVCKKLVDLMEGEIQVQSQPNIGTTFKLKVPVEIGLDKQHESKSTPESDSSNDDYFMTSFIPVSVLLVEDNELNQKLIAQMLSNYGFEVIPAGNGLECLSILQRKNVDIVLMDMQMPVMDGYEATHFIRENPDWCHLPIIAITANSLSSDREKCLACGCSSYLAKPFKSETLVREIKRLLNNDFIKDKNADQLSQQLITELLPEFMETLGETLDELHESIKMKDLPNIKSISHSLKGTAGMYGFMKISELAAQIEKAVLDKNYGQMYSLYQQIVVIVQHWKTRESSTGAI